MYLIITVIDSLYCVLFLGTDFEICYRLISIYLFEIVDFLVCRYWLMAGKISIL